MSDARAFIVGVACLASGVAMCARPRAMAEVYGLPRSGLLAVALGVRDTLIGGGLLSGRGRAAWWRARALSDGIDSALIAWSAVRDRRSVGLTALRVGVAWTLVGLARRESARAVTATG